jgi:uncharacterized protein YqjF (DUF2071 family)
VMMDQVSHRPWPLPRSPWVMAQTWHDLLFAHWPMPAHTLRREVPPRLELDTFDGQAWLAVTPFRMTGVRPRLLPLLPGLSAFPELNVRTYVTDGQKRGVWFFSLDAGNRAAVELARRWFHLPYFHARMSLEHKGDGVFYESRRIHRGAPAAEFRASYRPIGEVIRATSGSLEHWLTERYCLYAMDERQRLFRAEIHHVPWPLQLAAVEIEINTMAAGHGFVLAGGPSLAHFSRRLDVRVWQPRRVAR